MRNLKLTQTEIDVLVEQLHVNACTAYCKAEQMGLTVRDECSNCQYTDIVNSIINKIENK